MCTDLRRTVFACALVVVALSGSLLSAAQPPRRIHDDLRGQRSLPMPHTTSPRIEGAEDLGEVAATTAVSDVTLHFSLSAAQQADLDALLKRQGDRSNRDYHKWLTPEQFASRYGLADADLQRVTQWLQSNGLTFTGTARSKTWISFSGIAADIQNAFGTTLHRYSVAGETHFANQSPITIPAALSGVFGAVRGLNNFRPKPRNVGQGLRPRPRFTSSISGNHFITPDDFATIYNVKPLYNSGVNGSGQKIAVAGQTDIGLTDVRAFRQAAGLSPNDPQIVLAGTDPGTSSSDVSEANLDMEWAGAIAPQATIIFVNSSSAFNSATYAIDNNLAPVVSLSYGACEGDFSRSDINSLAATFQQGNAQGITIISAGGDNGAADCDVAPSATAVTPSSATHGLAVDVPSSIPYVTGMGGTTLQDSTGSYWSSGNNSSNGSALSYIPEAAWNDTAQDGELSGSGGGASTFFTKPSWQLGQNVPNDGARDTPDVSLASSPDHDGYLVCSGGTCVNGFRNTDDTLNVVGGSSVASPSFAGIVALLIQQTGSRQGNINPGLYSLASISSNAFHDITQGNNIVPCTAGSTGCPASGSIGFSAAAGYDQVTGLGSVDAYNLVSQWGSDFNVAIAPTSLTVNPRTSNTASVQITKVANFSGTVTFTCTVAAPLTNTTCSVPGSVNGSGTAILTVSNSSAASIERPFNMRGIGKPDWRLLTGATLFLMVLMLCRAISRRPAALGGTVLMLLACTTACDDGGSSSSTVTQTQALASVTGVVTVTAISGIEQHSATVSVTVP